MSELYNIYLRHPQVTTDSRDCPEGSIFFALKGTTFNGNAYAAQALQKGCAYAVIDEPQYAVDARYIVVDDVLATLQQLAREHRLALGTTVIGVTGTNGKTTTKELIAAVLSQRYNVLYTQGNHNNHIGVPLTLLRLTAAHDIAVIEMGANHPGEIKTLADIAEPDHGIITNVGMAHLEGFGSLDGVLHTKGELYDKLRHRDGAHVFIDADNPLLLSIADGLTLVKYALGSHDSDVRVWGEITQCDPCLSFRWTADGHSHDVRTHLVGAYNVLNMLAAITIGRTFHVDDDLICRALEAYQPTNNRSQLTTTARNRLIVDAYNANPTSMHAALDNFLRLDAPSKMLILGDMLELGTTSAEEHQKVVDYLMEHHVSDVWLVGEHFGSTRCTYRKFRDIADVRQTLTDMPLSNRLILIKGSNAIHLSQLTDDL